MPCRMPFCYQIHALRLLPPLPHTSLRNTLTGHIAPLFLDAKDLPCDKHCIACSPSSGGYLLGVIAKCQDHDIIFACERCNQTMIVFKPLQSQDQKQCQVEFDIAETNVHHCQRWVIFLFFCKLVLYVIRNWGNIKIKFR